MTSLKVLLTSIIFIGSQSLLAAPIFSLGDNLSMGDSLEVTNKKLSSFCQSLKTIELKSPRYSLAESNESHILCSQYKDASISFKKMVLTLADNRLEQVQARGFDLKKLEEKLGTPDGVYLAMNNYQKGQLWLDKKRNHFSWLTMQGRHPNLFSWHNPLLENPEMPSYSENIQPPRILNFEVSMDELLPLFKSDCPLMNIEKSNRIWLPNKPTTQTQVNCFAYPYAGFPRKLEAVFGDGKLQVIWVLSGKQEEARLRNLLLKEYGNPSITNSKWEVFSDGRISLRKDKPELLILSDEMIPYYMDMLKESTK